MPSARPSEQNPDLRLKVLVGLSVDTSLGQLLEVARAQRKASNQEVIEALLSDLQKALSHPQLDDKTLARAGPLFPSRFCARGAWSCARPVLLLTRSCTCSR